MTRRIGAPVRVFHHIPDISIEHVLQEGVVRPAIFRLEPSIWLGDCADRIRNLVWNLREPNDVATQALGDLPAEIAAELQTWQEAHGVIPTSRQTDFQCWDFLAGDLGSVFLSVGDWVHWGRRDPSGLVFNGQELVKLGARVRPYDLALAYRQALEDFLVQPFTNIEEAKRVIRETLEQVRWKGELRYVEAAEFLRKKGPWVGDARPEVVWTGDLEVNFATELWRDGLQVGGPFLEIRDKLEGS